MVLVLLLLTPDPKPGDGNKTKGLRRLFRGDVLAFAIPVTLCGLAVAAYNYARFDNPFEFGTRYLLGADAYRNFHMSAANLAHGLYYLLIWPPDLVPEFPFVRLALRQPGVALNHVLVSGYFLEPIAGILSLCPLILLTPALCLKWELWKRGRAAFRILVAMFVSAACTILVIAFVPFVSHRYEVDFAPYLLFVACVVAAAGLQMLRRKAARMIVTTGVVILLLYSIAANLALGVQGPYDQFVQSNPQRLRGARAMVQSGWPLSSRAKSGLAGRRGFRVSRNVRFSKGAATFFGGFRLALSVVRRMR